MIRHLTPQPQYDVRARRISGTHAEKLEQIDAAIQELLDIKALECAADNPNVRFLAVPRARSHALAMTATIVALLILLVLLLGVHPAHAQESDASSRTPQWNAGGFVDVGYLWDSNSPANHLFRTRGTTPRVDELDVNMASVYFNKPALDDSRWGVQLAVQDGRDSDGFGFSPTAPNVSGAKWLRRLGPTNVSYLVPAGRGLSLQGGIFNSVIGYDSLYSKDNFAYTRPWGADFTPYFMAGVNATYPVSDRLTVTGVVVNSYFHLSHPNSAPNAGGQVAYSLSPATSLKQAVLIGPEQATTSPTYWRVLSDTIVEHKAGRLTTAAELQLATERVAATAARASWVSAQWPVHCALEGPWSVTARPEFARDRSGRYTSVAQTVWAFASTLERRQPVHDIQTILRLEYRFDHATGPTAGFFQDGTSASDVALTPSQQLLVFSAIVAFEHAKRG